jgi:hypothetical protein
MEIRDQLTAQLSRSDPDSDDEHAVSRPGIQAELKEPVIFDGRNLYDPDLIKVPELRYYSVGRHPV